MMSQAHPTLPLTQSALNAMDGVCYVIGFDGSIIAIGGPHWDAAAEACHAAHLRAEALVGANVFDHTTGEEVIYAYREYLRALQAGRARQITFDFRCDAPTLRREMRMTMTPIMENSRPIAVVFQSLTLSETERAPVNLFDAVFMKRLQADEMSLPLVTMCSYCHSIKVRGTSADWLTTEAYYQNGGTDRVRIGHGMCPRCFKKARQRS